jgi:hypothetical protein
MGYVALTTHLRPCNYSVGHKRLERISSNSSNHCGRPSSIEPATKHQWQWTDTIFCPIIMSCNCEGDLSYIIYIMWWARYALSQILQLLPTCTYIYNNKQSSDPESGDQTPSTDIYVLHNTTVTCGYTQGFPQTLQGIVGTFQMLYWPQKKAIKETMA